MKEPHQKHAGALHPRNQQQGLEQRAERRLVAAFEAAGWEVSRSAQHGAAADLLCRKGKLSYAVEIKASAGRARRPMLRALLAEAILQSQVKARERGAKPLAMLVASSLSAEIVQELGEYVQRFGGGAAWGIQDERGQFQLHGPGLDSILAPAPEQRAGSGSAAEHARQLHNPFSDLGQWMLKLLVAPNVPERWLQAPRRPVRGVADLAELARVSPASASKFLSALEADGYVVHVDGALRLVRAEALFEAWRIASQRPIEERLARFLLPAPIPAKRLRAVLAARGNRQGKRSNESAEQSSSAASGSVGERVCLALFSACSELELGFVRGAPVHIYAENLSNEFLAGLELHPAEHRSEADVIVRRPRFPESIFRGAVNVQGIAVADIVQCWLDVSFHPARGAEQAAELAKRLRVAQWSP